LERHAEGSNHYARRRGPPRGGVLVRPRGARVRPRVAAATAKAGSEGRRETGTTARGEPLSSSRHSPEAGAACWDPGEPAGAGARSLGTAVTAAPSRPRAGGPARPALTSKQRRSPRDMLCPSWRRGRAAALMPRPASRRRARRGCARPGSMGRGSRLAGAGPGGGSRARPVVGRPAAAACTYSIWVVRRPAPCPRGPVHPPATPALAPGLAAGRRPLGRWPAIIISA
jgi:hypothetical protein